MLRLVLGLCRDTRLDRPWIIWFNNICFDSVQRFPAWSFIPRKPGSGKQWERIRNLRGTSAAIASAFGCAPRTTEWRAHPYEFFKFPTPAGVCAISSDDTLSSRTWRDSSIALYRADSRDKRSFITKEF